MKNKLLGLLLALATVVSLTSCATTETSNVKKGKQDEIASIKSIKVTLFKSEDQAIALATQNSIIELLLSSDIRVVSEGNADAIMKGVITFTVDSQVSGGLYGSAQSGTTTGVYGGGSGRYVSGISAQIVKGNEIIASATVTQARTDLWIPDPVEVMARKLGKKIKSLFAKKRM